MSRVENPNRNLSLSPGLIPTSFPGSTPNRGLT